MIIDEAPGLLENLGWKTELKVTPGDDLDVTAYGDLAKVYLKTEWQYEVTIRSRSEIHTIRGGAKDMEQGLASLLARSPELTGGRL